MPRLLSNHTELQAATDSALAEAKNVSKLGTNKPEGDIDPASPQAGPRKPGRPRKTTANQSKSVLNKPVVRLQEEEEDIVQTINAQNIDDPNATESEKDFTVAEQTVTADVNSNASGAMDSKVKRGRPTSSKVVTAALRTTFAKTNGTRNNINDDSDADSGPRRSKRISQANKKARSSKTARAANPKFRQGTVNKTALESKAMRVTKPRRGRPPMSIFGGRGIASGGTMARMSATSGPGDETARLSKRKAPTPAPTRGPPSKRARTGRASSTASMPRRQALSSTFEVEAIRGFRSNRVTQKPEYLVKWKGYKKRTWEPPAHLAGCQELVDEFMASKEKGAKA